MRSETANSRCKQISCLFRVLQVSVKYQQVFLSSVRGTLLREISNVSQTLNMHLIIPTLLSFALGALAAPSISLDERQSQWTGTCILASNTCNITSPAGLAGLMVNCAAGAGLDGTESAQLHYRRSRKFCCLSFSLLRIWGDWKIYLFESEVLLSDYHRPVVPMDCSRESFVIKERSFVGV